MGCTSSSMSSGGSSKHTAKDETTKTIDEELKADKRKAATVTRMLLLGAGESGKSTVLKQMKLLYSGKGWSDSDREEFIEVILTNCSQSMQTILDAVPKLGLIEEFSREWKDRANIVRLHRTYNPQTWSEQLYPHIKALWAHPTVQKAFERSSEYQLNDSAGYYFENLDRLAQADYLPSDQDILRSRVKTTGIVESKVEIENKTFLLLDVGGQRSERKKWIHCFENVDVLIFVVALSEYDQTLREDSTASRMEEAMLLFDSTANSRWFTKSTLIVFFNKVDLLKLKLPKKPLSKIYPEFSSALDLDAKAACSFLKKGFVELYKSDTKPLYTHFTCATDTKAMRTVMAAVTDSILRRSLASSGLLA